MMEIPTGRHLVYQTSLMSALLDGIYDGDTAVATLLEHGDFGLGTFNALDGEMLILDGVCYRMRVDGTVSPADGGDLSPFAVVTEFVPTVTIPVDGLTTRDEAVALINGGLDSANYLYAVRLTGEFEWVRVRAVHKQEKPYQPMSEAVRGEKTLAFGRSWGVVAGFRTPLYGQGIGVPGGHVHFIDAERQQGGHVLDFALLSGTIEICIGTDLHLELPLTAEFRHADLSPDNLADQIEQTENHR
ncbi:acetolactate decarboxylase [Cryobacterium sp.]|jgi:acetolactate decarboxylase|uniref:acetolactate decarboxylase n=1 Tax=Cryobacterium sp. TaxID=1926290 RepID=UPI0026285D3F|nr:acetolactate decarboxylase [Cryobacterium sp.]MCU1445500.1 alpha-acetolactate decarboxylase [Cryobacterium sp.]